MNDAEFLDAFHRSSLSSDEFRHRGHLRLAWLVLSDHSTDEAARIVAREIKRFAAAQGAAGRYHETLTRFWIHLVSHAMQNARDVKNVDELLAKFPLLLDKNLPYLHWRSKSINSEQARMAWVEPDLLPLP